MGLGNAHTIPLNHLQTISRWILLTACCWLTACRPDASCPASLKNVASDRNQALAAADSELGECTASQAIVGQAPDRNGHFAGRGWRSSRGSHLQHWLWVRFREPARIDKMVLRSTPENYPVDFIGECSLDGGVTFESVLVVSNNCMAQHPFTFEQKFTPLVADNFRLRILRSASGADTNGTCISELQVLGSFMPTGAISREAEGGGVEVQPGLAPSQTGTLDIREQGDQFEFRSPYLRVALSKRQPGITAICWDSLGEGKLEENLLKSSSDGGIRMSDGEVFAEVDMTTAPTISVAREGNVIRYTRTYPHGFRTIWEIRVREKSIDMMLTSTAAGSRIAREPPGISFAFDVGKTPVSPQANPREAAAAPLPCLLQASDYGGLLLRASSKTDLHLKVKPTFRRAARWDAWVGENREPRSSDGLISLPPGTHRFSLECRVETVQPLPNIVSQEPRLRTLPRTWLNIFQYRPELRILANNVVSDNAPFCMFFYADYAVFTPTLPGNVEVMNMVRESLDQYLAGAPGYGIGQEDILTDVYPSLLIAAWSVIRVTGDKEILQRWLPALEQIASKLLAQDRDGNGLPESIRPGLSGTTVTPTGNWWDVVNFGHEDAYVSALCYRALGALADLERLGSRPEQAARFDARADMIRKAYVGTFMNPRTGLLAGWKDAQGNLHDYCFVFVNSLAITYGLVPDSLANDIVDRIEAKLKETGYTRFELGLPGNLVPIPQADYSINTWGSPSKEDGSDTYGRYQNGGATACFAYFYIQALYQLGRRTEAERILWPMMQTFAQGGFQNGVSGGGDWREWNGRPCGYEGFLADSYYAQLAVFTGHYGIAFGPGGFRLQDWSPLRGKPVSLELKYMGAMASIPAESEIGPGLAKGGSHEK